MPIRLGCNCGKKLQVKDDLAGKKIKCPGCAEVLRVPGPGGSSAGSGIKTPARGKTTLPKSPKGSGPKPASKAVTKKPERARQVRDEDAPPKKKKKAKSKGFFDTNRSWSNSGIFGGLGMLVLGVALLAYLFLTDQLLKKLSYPIAGGALIFFGIASIANGLLGGQLWISREDDDDDGKEQHAKTESRDEDDEDDEEDGDEDDDA